MIFEPWRPRPLRVVLTRDPVRPPPQRSDRVGYGMVEELRSCVSATKDGSFGELAPRAVVGDQCDARAAVPSEPAMVCRLARNVDVLRFFLPRRQNGRLLSA